jgi:hypothetical protein
MDKEQKLKEVHWKVESFAATVVPNRPYNLNRPIVSRYHPKLPSVFTAKNCISTAFRRSSVG